MDRKISNSEIHLLRKEYSVLWLDLRIINQVQIMGAWEGKFGGSFSSNPSVSSLFLLFLLLLWAEAMWVHGAATYQPSDLVRDSCYFFALASW